jgi:hypothetical protein
MEFWPAEERGTDTPVLYRNCTKKLWFIIETTDENKQKMKK